MRKITKALATVGTAGALALAPVMAGTASAAPNNGQLGGAAGLVAAVVQLQDVNVEVINVDDVNVAVTNVLNRNRVLNEAFQNFLNNNDVDVDVEDVVNVGILSDGTVAIFV